MLGRRCHSQRRNATVTGAVSLPLLLFLAAPVARAALPNVDGVWQGKGVIGLGLGTTFAFAAEAGNGGVEGYVGGFVEDAGGKCAAAAEGRAAYAAPWGAVRLFTNAPPGALTLKTATRLTGVQYDTGSVGAGEWTSNVTMRPALTRLAKLPAGLAISAANAYVGCAAEPTPVPGGGAVAGAKGSTHDGAFAPLVPSVFDGLPALAARGGPPFLRGFFAAPAAVGAYAAGGFAWAVSGGGGGGTGLEATGGHFLSHTCPGPYSYRAVVARVTAKPNGDAAASAYCEAGEFDPATGVLKIWVGEPETSKRPVCPRTRGAPTFTSVRVGGLTGAKAGRADAPPCTAYGPADDGDRAGGKAAAVEGGGGGGAAGSGAAALGFGWLQPLAAAAVLLLACC